MFDEDFLWRLRGLEVRLWLVGKGWETWGSVGGTAPGAGICIVSGTARPSSEPETVSPRFARFGKVGAPGMRLLCGGVPALRFGGKKPPCSGNAAASGAGGVFHAGEAGAAAAGPLKNPPCIPPSGAGVSKGPAGGIAPPSNACPSPGCCHAGAALGGLAAGIAGIPPSIPPPTGPGFPPPNIPPAPGIPCGICIGGRPGITEGDGTVCGIAVGCGWPKGVRWRAKEAGSGKTGPGPTPPLGAGAVSGSRPAPPVVREANAPGENMGGATFTLA